MTHILVIDDEVSMRSIISQMLEDKGYKVTAAEDGEEGLRILEDNPALFNLVICDINMPKIDGFEFLKKIRSENPKFPVILITGVNENVAELVGKEYQANAVLKKPFIVDDVMKIVEKIISGNQ